MSTDSLIPLLLTCANEKEFKIKIDSLKSVVSIGIKVGKQTFTQYILPVFEPIAKTYSFFRLLSQ